MAQVKVCWSDDEASARQLAHDRWRSSWLPGELSQELAMPVHFSSKLRNWSPKTRSRNPYPRSDPDLHAEAIDPCFEAGYDEVL